MIEEINRKYEGYEGQGRADDRAAWFRARRFILGAVALFLALIFLFSVTGRWLSVFGDPAFTFLRESWALSGDPLVEEVRGSVVQVYVESRSESGQRRGSGFNIQPDGLIVTNRHMVENAISVRVSFPGLGTYRVYEWAVSPYVDLAVLRLRAENLPTVSISEAPVLPGEEVLVIGNPLQFVSIANMGTLVGYRENRGREAPLLVVEALIYPGSSGSPVFNDRGEVIGVIFATLRNSDPAEVRGLAVGSAELKLFLTELDIY